ncbi:MAG: DUF2066 domain-containing protein [Alphaproteobacteria bacterium]|nr:DUF2066 domain-containing protein [Alphaproteobacteria bacterium]MBF0251215.1 DUF2066 domain-containing protein [Alphaproteobacteria bacterium]
MTQYEEAGAMRARIVYSFLFILFGALGAFRADAAAPSLFEVDNVAVDVTAESATQARAKALAEAERKAYVSLLRRLTLQAYHDRLPDLGPAQVTALVRDFVVAEEKASSVRYIAKLNYHFRAEAVRALLEQHGIPFAETMSKPVVILPVYQAAGALVLWDDPNPWRAAWRNYGQHGPGQGLVPMVLPSGDLTDVGVIGAEQAIEGDMTRLTEIARRYEAGDAVVAHGILRSSALGGRPELEVYLTRFGSTLQEHTVVKTFTAAADESVDALLARAVGQLTHQIEDHWKQDNMIQSGEIRLFTVSVPVTGLQDWVRTRDRLNGVAIVRRVEVSLMRRDEVRMHLHFIGDVEQLALSLDQADLALWEEAGRWFLGEKNPAAPAR